MLAQGHHSRQTSPKGRRECNTYRSQRMDLRGSRMGKTDALERYYSKTSRERRGHTSASSNWHRRRGHKFKKYLGGKWVQIWWLIPCRQHGAERNDKCFPSVCFRDWVDCETTDMIQSTGSGMHLGGGAETDERSVLDTLPLSAHGIVNWKQSPDVWFHVRHRSAVRAREKDLEIINIWL